MTSFSWQVIDGIRSSYAITGASGNVPERVGLPTRCTQTLLVGLSNSVLQIVAHLCCHGAVPQITPNEMLRKAAALPPRDELAPYRK